MPVTQQEKNKFANSFLNELNINLTGAMSAPNFLLHIDNLSMFGILNWSQPRKLHLSDLSSENMFSRIKLDTRSKVTT